MAEKKGAGKVRGKRKISINGREYPCRITMGAMLRFKRATGKDVSKMVGDDMEELMVFIHACVMSACRADGVECDMSVDDMADHLTAEDINDFYGALTAGEESKKKVTIPA